MTLQRYEHTGGAVATTLNGSITAASSSFTVNSGTGYPTGAVGLFVIKIDAGTASEEKILCSARSTNTFTVNSGGRGYDGTSATSHSNGAAVEHCFAAAEADDDNAHIYTTTRDDHTQYLLTAGTRASTGNQSFGAGLTVTSGGLTVSSGTTAVGALTASTGVFSSTLAASGTVTGSSTVTGTALIPSGLTGATTASRYVGATNGGPPASGTFSTGDMVIDTKYGIEWVCTSGGTSGTWTNIGGGNIVSMVYRNGAWTTNTVATQIAFDTATLDPNTMTNLSTGTCTVPVLGVYHVLAQYRYTSTATTQEATINIEHNGVQAAAIIIPVNTAAAGQSALASVMLNCAASDTITVLQNTSTGSLTGATGAAATFMHVRLT